MYNKYAIIAQIVTILIHVRVIMSKELIQLIFTLSLKQNYHGEILFIDDL